MPSLTTVRKLRPLSAGDTLAIKSWLSLGKRVFAVVAIDAVPPGGFGGIEGRIGAREERFDVVAFGHHRDSRADGEARGPGNACTRNRSANIVAPASSVPGSTTMNSSPPLRVTTSVSRACWSSSEATCFEQPIAVYVAMLLVEGLEMIEIEDRHRKQHAIAAVHRQIVFQRLDRAPGDCTGPSADRTAGPVKVISRLLCWRMPS